MVGWDKKEFLESNVHVYGGDDTRIIVYDMEMWLKGGGSEKHQKKKKKKKNLGNNPLNIATIMIFLLK